jgi:glutamate synthase domain-containing protein 3
MMRRKTDTEAIIDAVDVHYRHLNVQIRELMSAGIEKIVVNNVHGQRYIGIDLNKPVEIEIHGAPGNDLGAFMDGPEITVFGNVQDGMGNMMNDGKIIVHGRTGDTTGLSACGGEMYIKESAGYRAGARMKTIENKIPALIIGSTAQDFIGEYMTGGILVLLGIGIEENRHKANFIGTGMRGGTIFYRGSINEHQLCDTIDMAELNAEDINILVRLITNFSNYFGYDTESILKDKFSKLYPIHPGPNG